MARRSVASAFGASIAEAPFLVVRTREALRRARGALAEPVGAVLTMGALHEGHRALLERARAECASVVASTFVNPTQFGPAEDFARYPRDEAGDLAILEATGVDVVFIPPVEEIYPAGAGTTIDVGPIAEPLEGAARPGHFRGVATVVTVLFDLIRPDRTYFGQKDAQQCLVVRRLVDDLALPIEVVVCPTVREADGLAVSSRNRLLSPVERAAATVLYRALEEGRRLIESGERDGEIVRERMRDVLAEETLVQPDYVSVADGSTLRELDAISGGALLSLAARLGTTRLIDNVPLTVS
jgi:pantoate--beta-alanine ligase